MEPHLLQAGVIVPRLDAGSVLDGRLLVWRCWIGHGILLGTEDLGAQPYSRQKTTKCDNKGGTIPRRKDRPVQSEEHRQITAAVYSNPTILERPIQIPDAR
jgi:hypothetical protein